MFRPTMISLLSRRGYTWTRPSTGGQRFDRGRKNRNGRKGRKWDQGAREEMEINRKGKQSIKILGRLRLHVHDRMYAAYILSTNQ